MAATGSSGIKRLLKCFCGCSEYTPEELNHIGGLIASKMLVHERASQLFRNYLEKERSGDKSMPEQQLEVFKLCEQYLAKGGQLPVDEISKGLRSDLEDELLAAIRSGEESIKNCLQNIQSQCGNDIDVSQEYKNFKRAIAAKLDYNMQVQNNES